MSSDLRQALRDALPGAMKDRDTPARNAIRAALAAIENAEAVADPQTLNATESPHIAGARIGVGAGEADRKELDDERILEIVSSQRDEWLAAAADSRRAGAIQRAEEMEAEAAALDAFLC